MTHRVVIHGWKLNISWVDVDCGMPGLAILILVWHNPMSALSLREIKLKIFAPEKKKQS